MLLKNESKIKNIFGVFNKKPAFKVSSYEYDYNEEDLHPTKETLEAMEEVKSGKVSKPYSNIEELMKDLLK